MKTYLTDAERHVSPQRIHKEYPYCVRFQLPVTKEAVYLRWFQNQNDAEKYLGDLPSEAKVLHETDA